MAVLMRKSGIAGLQHATKSIASSQSSHPPNMAAARRDIVTALLQLGLFDSEAVNGPGACMLQEVELMLKVRGEQPSRQAARVIHTTCSFYP